MEDPDQEEVAMDDKAQLLELYEATGDPDAFTRAKPLYEQALAGPEASDPNVRLGYGYLLECHGATRCARRPSSTSARSSWTPTPTSRATS